MTRHAVRFLVLLPVVALVALVAAWGPAAATAGWSAPQALSGRSAYGPILLAGFDATGRGLIVVHAAWEPRFQSATRPAGASAWALGPPMPTGMGFLHAQPAIALYGRSRAVLVTTRRDASGAALRYRMVSAFGRSDARFETLTTLDLGVRGPRRGPRAFSTPALAVDAAGGGLAAWSRDDGTTTAIRVVERGPGGAWSRARTLSGSGAVGPAVAADDRSGRVAAWYRHGRIEARTRPAHGRWGPVVAVARPGRAPAVLRAAIDRGGRVLLAWSTADVRSGRPTALASVAAVRRPGTGWRRQVLQRFGGSGLPVAGAEQRLFALMPAAGGGAVAWQGSARGQSAVMVARLGAGRRLSAPEVLDGAGAQARPTDLIATPGGALVVVWEREAGMVVRSELRVAAAPPGRLFGPAETLPALCPATSLCMPFGGRAAFDRATGRLTVAWVERDDAAYRVYAATRAER